MSSKSIKKNTLNVPATAASCDKKEECCVDMDTSNSTGASVAIDMGKPMVVVTERAAPDGGFGWAVAITSFLVTFLVTGFSKSFGVIRSAVLEDFPTSTSLEAGWITGLIGLVSLLMSPFTGMLVAAQGPGRVIATGFVLCSVGLGVSYFANSAMYLIFSLGSFMGVGSSFVITSAVTGTAKYFTTRKPTAMTVALSGGCIGAMVMPFILKALLVRVGLSFAFVALAGIFLCMALTGLIYANPESHFLVKETEIPEDKMPLSVDTTEAVQKTPLENFRAAFVERMPLRYFSRPLFVAMVFSVLALSMSSPHFVAQINGRAKAVGATAHELWLLTLLTQLADLGARLIYGMLASKSTLKRTTEYAAVVAVAASCAVLSFFCNSFWQLAVLSFVGSFCAGVINIAIPLVLSANHGAKNMSNTLNLIRWCQAFGSLVYRLVTPELPSMVNEAPVILVLNTTNLCFCVLMAVLMRLLPSDSN